VRQDRQLRRRFLLLDSQPGLCNVNDANRLIAASIANCQLLVYLTPSRLRIFIVTQKMVDHQIQNVLPFFQQVNGEASSEALSQLSGLFGNRLDGSARRPDRIHIPPSDYRNSINFYAKRFVAELL